MNREEYEKGREERSKRIFNLQEERKQILQQRHEILTHLHEDKTVRFPLSRQSDMSINAAVNVAREKIPQYENKLRRFRDEHAAKTCKLSHPYQGELGIGSYEPWQLEDFYFVRDFVRGWVEEVVNFIVYEPCSDSKQRLSETTIELLQASDLENSQVVYCNALKDVQRAVVEEVYKDLIYEAATESLSICCEASQVVCNMVLLAVNTAGGIKDEETIHTLVSNTFDQMKKERSHQHGVWNHSQRFDFLGETETSTSVEEDTFEGKVLSFKGVTPYKHLQRSSDFQTYRDSESNFWSHNSPVLSILPLPRRYNGVNCTALSSDHSLLAVGTVQGDIAVWDISMYPPRVLRGCKGNATILVIHWSLDSSQILTLNKHGVIQVWSMSNGNAIDIKGFEPTERNIGFKPTELQCVICLEPSDLLFMEGTLKSTTNIAVKPTFVVFHPSSTFFGHQDSITVGLANGTILKLNLGVDSGAPLDVVPRLVQNASNKINKNIDAELFKAHKHPIELIAFVNNAEPMITVDSQGFIYLWDYSEENLSGYGWFTPLSSYRLDMSKMTYKCGTGSTEKIEFVDTVKGTGKIKELNRQDMVKKRKQTQTFINSLNLGTFWKTKDIGTQKIEYLYAPRNVPNSGATFHSVTYYKETKVLAQYSTKFYQPIRVPCSKMMACKLNPLGNKLMFSLLFDDVPPKTHHVVLVTIDIPAMNVNANLLEVQLSEQEYRKCKQSSTCDFDFSKIIGATGSEYIFTSVCGNVEGYSMTTGSIIMASSEKETACCNLSQEQASTFTEAQVKVASQVLGLCIVFYAPRQNTVKLLHLINKNSRANRQQVWQDFWTLHDGRTVVPVQQGICKKQWSLDGQLACHVQCAIEKIVLDLVDTAVMKSNGIENDPDSHSLENRTYPFIKHC